MEKKLTYPSLSEEKGWTNKNKKLSYNSPSLMIKVSLEDLPVGEDNAAEVPVGVRDIVTGEDTENVIVKIWREELTVYSSYHGEKTFRFAMFNPFAVTDMIIKIPSFVAVEVHGEDKDAMMFAGQYKYNIYNCFLHMNNSNLHLCKDDENNFYFGQLTSEQNNKGLKIKAMAENGTDTVPSTNWIYEGGKQAPITVTAGPILADKNISDLTLHLILFHYNLICFLVG